MGNLTSSFSSRSNDLSHDSSSWKIVLSGFFLFFVLCLTVPVTIKALTLVVSIAAIVCLVGFRASICIPFLAVSLWVTMDGISTFYALSGKFALYEFCKVLFSFGIFVCILFFRNKWPKITERNVASVLEIVTAFAGIFSIDLISTRLLSQPLISILSPLTGMYHELIGVEVGVRMTSLFDNPNIFAGCMGIGVLLSLGLATTAYNVKERYLHIVCLAINALSFVLAFSMGASGMIALAFVVYLAVEHKERRAHLLVLMLETFILTMLAMFPIYLTAFDEWDGANPIPLLCTIVAAILLCVFDRLSNKVILPKLEQHTKRVIMLAIAVLVGLVAYLILAFQITGSITLEAGEQVRRAAYPATGNYTLQVYGDSPVDVVIESQNKQETMMHTSSILYSGPAEDAQFAVPQDSMVVYFDFTVEQAGNLYTASCSGDTGSFEIPLGYKLVPGFIANRMQGLLANENAIQRLVFFEDGIKIFTRSPIIGVGMGGFENAVLGVQDFYYTTKYVHNHYIQTLLEIGIVGLILFVGTLVVMAVVLIKNRLRKSEGHPLVPALLATLIFMAGHGAVEVVFSSNFYLPLAFTVFALICMCCGHELDLPNGTVRRIIPKVIAGLIAIYSVCLGGNMVAKSMQKSEGISFDTLETCVLLDRFEWADYALSYVYNMAQQPTIPSKRLATFDRYTARLEKVDSNTIPLYLAETYFRLGRFYDGFEMLEKYVKYTSSDVNHWNNAFHMMSAFHQNTQEYYDGVAAIYDLFDQWNHQNMGILTLDEESMTYVQAVIGLE